MVRHWYDVGYALRFCKCGRVQTRSEQGQGKVRYRVRISPGRDDVALKCLSISQRGFPARVSASSHIFLHHVHGRYRPFAHLDVLLDSIPIVLIIVQYTSTRNETEWSIMCFIIGRTIFRSFDSSNDNCMQSDFMHVPSLSCLSYSQKNARC